MVYIVFATLVFETAEDRESSLPAFRAHRDRCLADEPGTIQFDLCLPHDDDKTVLIYEAYVDQSAFEAHMVGESIKQAGAEGKALGLNYTVTTARGPKLD